MTPDGCPKAYLESDGDDEHHNLTAALVRGAGLSSLSSDRRSHAILVRDLYFVNWKSASCVTPPSCR